MNQDLTTGKPSRVLWKFCLPLFGSIIFQQLYNIADSFVAGKFIGENALAAVGNSYEITLIFIAFAFGCNIGCSVVAAQFFGAKDLRSMKTTIYTTLIASAGLCAVLMLVGLLLSRQLLGLINTPDEIMKDSQLYLNIYICGLPFVFFYNVATGIFSALGDSKTPFFFLMASSLSNIAVDILFVTAFGMGVDGVAWATFLCQGVSCVLALVFVFRRLAKIHLPEGQRAPVFSGRLLGRVARVAVEYPAAELRLRRQYRAAEYHQFVRHGRYGGLFRVGQAEQPRHHVARDAGQRHFELHGAEPRRTEAGPHPQRLPRGSVSCVGAVRPADGAVFLCGRAAREDLRR